MTASSLAAVRSYQIFTEVLNGLEAIFAELLKIMYIYCVQFWIYEIILQGSGAIKVVHPNFGENYFWGPIAQKLEPSAKFLWEFLLKANYCLNGISLSCNIFTRFLNNLPSEQNCWAGSHFFEAITRHMLKVKYPDLNFHTLFIPNSWIHKETQYDT